MAEVLEELPGDIGGRNSGWQGSNGDHATRGRFDTKKDDQLVIIHQTNVRNKHTRGIILR
jgi:hypothetical protein